MIRFFSYLLSLFFLWSCTGQDIKLNNGTFIEVSKMNGKDILFYPCSASINKIVLLDNSIEEFSGQESVKAKIINKKLNSNNVQVKLENTSYTFEIIDSAKHYWKINNRTYVESEFTNSIEKIAEPCTECYSKEECDYLKKQNRELTLDEFIYKDKKTIETIKGDFNNDSLEDAIIITDISNKNDVSEHYLLSILIQSVNKGLYKLFFESSNILPCLNCKEWSNDSDYSYYDVKLDNGTLYFSTNKTDNTANKWSTKTYLFKNVGGEMKLKSITEDYGNLDSDDENTKELGDLNSLNLKKFNIYSID